jgi:hypothetical protein
VDERAVRAPLRHSPTLIMALGREIVDRVRNLILGELHLGHVRAGDLYHLARNLRHRIRLVTPGSVLAMTPWIVAALGFSYYVTHFARYSVTYGSSGPIVVLMPYVFISSSALPLGAELDLEIRDQGARREGGAPRTQSPCASRGSASAPSLGGLPS